MPQNMVVGKLRIVGDGARSLDSDEKVRIYEQVEALSDLPLREGWVLLLDPLYPSLNFGPNGVHEYPGERTGNIVFSGGTWSGPDDHELLPRLLKAHPEIIELRRAEQATRSYPCPKCEVEFDTRAKAQAHEKAAHK